MYLVCHLLNHLNDTRFVVFIGRHHLSTLAQNMRAILQHHLRCSLVQKCDTVPLRRPLLPSLPAARAFPDLTKNFSMPNTQYSNMNEHMKGVHAKHSTTRQATESPRPLDNWSTTWQSAVPRQRFMINPGALLVNARMRSQTNSGWPVSAVSWPVTASLARASLGCSLGVRDKRPACPSLPPSLPPLSQSLHHNACTGRIPAVLGCQQKALYPVGASLEPSTAHPRGTLIGP